MPNYRRNRQCGGTYFFTVVTHNRRPFLTEPAARESLRGALRAVRRDRPFSVDAIVLLPDHLHCVWTLPAGDSDYSMRWRCVKRSFTKRYLRGNVVDAADSTSRAARGERGVWQRRFYEHTITDETDLRRCVDYLHVNPVKHRVVSRVADWPWSSFHRYVRLGQYAPGWGDSAEFYGDEWSKFE